jgi:hypothetical protein
VGCASEGSALEACGGATGFSPWGLHFFAKGQRIIAVHGIRNEAKEISKRDLRVALERKADWSLRYPL